MVKIILKCKLPTSRCKHFSSVGGKHLEPPFKLKEEKSKAVGGLGLNKAMLFLFYLNLGDNVTSLKNVLSLSMVLQDE
jgi:hypothetical protein